MKAPVLSVQGLRTYFHAEDRVVRAVDGISYDLHAGKTLAVVGESGSGKSVHALSILRLLPEPPAKIVAGRILYSGRDLLSMPPDELRGLRGNRIAMIFQEPMTSLNPVLTVGEQIAEAVVLHQKASPEKALAKAVDLLKKVGIPHASERVHDYPHQFSGGMRPRVMIAMAMALDPALLIADEPTTALDVTVQAQVLGVMQRLQEEFGTAIVLITHDLGVVAQMSDDVVVMYAGRAMERAPRRTVFYLPHNPYTRGLLASLPAQGGTRTRLTPIAGTPPSLIDPPEQCPFAPRCPDVFDHCWREVPRLDPVARDPRHTSACFLPKDGAALRPVPGAARPDVEREEESA